MEKIKQYLVRKYYMHNVVVHTNMLLLFSLLSHVQLFATPWTVAHQAPLSVGVHRQEYCSEQSFPSSVDLPDPGIEPSFPTLQADSLLSEPPGKPQIFQSWKKPERIFSTMIQFFFNFILFLNFTILYQFCQISK